MRLVREMVYPYNGHPSRTNHRCEKLAQSFYAVVPGRDPNPRPLDRESDALPLHHDATVLNINGDRLLWAHRSLCVWSVDVSWCWWEVRSIRPQRWSNVFTHWWSALVRRPTLSKPNKPLRQLVQVRYRRVSPAAAQGTRTCRETPLSQPQLQICTRFCALNCGVIFT